MNLRSIKKEHSAVTFFCVKRHGSLTVQFTIGSDGVVRDAVILRSVRKDLDAEAIRMVSSSPKWEPGKQDGKAVPVSFILPVVFKLQ